MNAVTKRQVVKVSTSKEINQFIVDNHTTMTQREIAEHFGVSTKSINCRVDRLRKKSVIQPSPRSNRDIVKALVPLEKAYNHLARKKELTKGDIQEFILKNYGKITNDEIATKLGIEATKVRGNVAALKRSGKIKNDSKKSSSNTYSNADGKNKQEARIKMVSSVEASGVTGTILTLPHIACTIEKMILDVTNGNDFIGCELDKATYNGMKRTVKEENLPIKTHLGAISDKIYGVDSDTYSSMILDYCGQVTTFAKEIQYAINNDLIKVKGKMCITFAKRGSSDTNNFIKKLANINSNTNDVRGEMERGVEAYFNKITGWNYEIEEIFNYQDKGKSPMMLVIIKRVK